jgi:hypothetical protein
MPTMTVQLPDTDGTMGNSKGGAGNVNAVWANAELVAFPTAPSAAKSEAKKIVKNARRGPPFVDVRRPAWTGERIGGL